MIKKINVTARDIKYGKPRNSYFCPVARAIKRRIHDSNVQVTPEWCHIDYKKIYFPDEVNVFITAFDNYQKVEPFSFEIDIPNANS